LSLESFYEAELTLLLLFRKRRRLLDQVGPWWLVWAQSSFCEAELALLLLFWKRRRLLDKVDPWGLAPKELLDLILTFFSRKDVKELVLLRRRFWNEPSAKPILGV
jgi:hypothetical protein